MQAITTISFSWALALSVTAGAADLSVRTFTIETGNAVQQTVLPITRLNGTADLLLIQVQDDGQRSVQRLEFTGDEYAFAGQSLPLYEDVILVDIGRLKGHDVIIMFTREGAYLYDPETHSRRQILPLDSIYGSPVRGVVPWLDLFRDINNDGRDDFFVPTFEGFLAAVQLEDGSFAEAVNVGPPPMTEVSYNNYPWYQPAQPHLTDTNSDERSDLVFRQGNQLAIYSQQDDGNFVNQPVFREVGFPIRFDNLDHLSIGTRDEDQSNSKANAVFHVGDLDGDRVTDLVVATVRSEGVFRKQTTFEFYPGFASQPAFAVQSKGFYFDSWLTDYSGDGQMDLVLSTVEIGLGKIVSALLTGSIKIDLDFYVMQNGRYADSPSIQRRMTATFDLGSGDFFLPTVLLTDVNRDGIDDLLIQDGPDKLEVFIGGGEDLFARQAQVIKVAMPNDPELVRLWDLNGDGRKDLLMRHETPGKPRKIVVMIWD